MKAGPELPQPGIGRAIHKPLVLTFFGILIDRMTCFQPPVHSGTWLFVWIGCREEICLIDEA